MKMKYALVLGAVLGMAAAQVALAQTALQLEKNGDDYVGVQSKDKILEIYSERSAASLTPSIWHIVFYDPDVTSKDADIKFGAGQEMEVSHPFHPFTMPAKARDILDQSKLHVDSDRALHIATSQPLLNGLTLRTSRMTLESTNDGVTWKVELWAAKVGDPSRQVGIGSVYISADTGSVVRSDLRPSNVN